MTRIITIDKTGSIKEQNIKKFDESELYKKAGFKTSKNFVKNNVWETVETANKTYSNITLYGKTEGSAGRENKYEMPPPSDKVLFFGTIVIVSYDENDNAVDLTKPDWLAIYDTLFGGFEDLLDDEETDEEEIVDPSLLTKHGYLKDDFIADDDDEEEDELEYDSELSEEEYFH